MAILLDRPRPGCSDPPCNLSGIYFLVNLVMIFWALRDVRLRLWVPGPVCILQNLPCLCHLGHPWLS